MSHSTITARASAGSPGPRKKAAKKSALATYQEMRSFARTPEPSGATRRKRAAGPLSFVVQQHAASHLHYDFRLELDGVLLSWAVPKGPSLRAGERRLAVRTEDHPLDYADFEGVIPKGEYGGGSVLVWDRGAWQPEGDAREAVRKGKLTFELAGEKLQGRFHLVRRKLAGKRENWLLFKGKDEAASAAEEVVDARPESVLSGKTIDEISEGGFTAEAGAPEKKKRGAGGRALKPEAEPVADMVELVKQLKPGFSLTNLDKVLFPEQGLRKAEIIAYYVSVASVMLPYISGRPLVLVRCPNGPGGQCFYQKHIGKGVPDAVQRVSIQEKEKRAEYATVRDLNGLIALAQLGVLEIHTWGCHADKVESPDLFVFDLDPDEGLAWERVVEAALDLKDRLSVRGLNSFVKTTGGKGLHVVVPVQRGLSWDAHKAFSHTLVSEMASAEPKLYVTNMSKAARKGRLFLDYLRNGRGATAVAPYSTRARKGAYVATPLRWDELGQGSKPRDFDVRSLLRRLEQQKIDPWQGFFEPQKLPALRARNGAKKRANSARPGKPRAV